MKIKPRKTITIRLPDGFNMEISNRANKRAKETGKHPNMTEVILTILKKGLGI